MKPGDLVGFRIRLYVTLEVDIIALFDLISLQFGSHLQSYHRSNCKKEVI